MTSISSGRSAPRENARSRLELGSHREERHDLTTLLALVEVSGLQLPADGRVTIFAPTNKAFAAIPADKVNFLTSEEGRATLRAILKHHILPMALDSGSLLQRRGVVALWGQNLPIDGIGLTIAGASFLKTDVPFDGGIVYVIDCVMMPETRSVAEIVSQDPRLSTLLKAVTTAGLATQLGSENEGPWTVLAPSNEAFAALGEETTRASHGRSFTTGECTGRPRDPQPHPAQRHDSPRTIRTNASQPRRGLLLAGGRTNHGGWRGHHHGRHRGVKRRRPRHRSGDRPSTIRGGNNWQKGTKATALSVSGLVELAIERGVPIFNDGNPEACARDLRTDDHRGLIDLASEAVGNDADEYSALRIRGRPSREGRYQTGVDFPAGDGSRVPGGESSESALIALEGATSSESFPDLWRSRRPHR